MDGVAPVPVLPVPPVLFAGPTLIGCLLTWLLYGVFLVQAVQYTQHSAVTDRPWVRGLALVVGLIQGIHISFIAQVTWHMCVLGFLDPMNLLIPPITAPVTPWLNGLMTLCVQCYFAWKIYALSQGNKIWLGYSGFIGVLSVIQFIFAILIGRGFLAIDRDVTRMQELKMPITVHLVVSAIGDVLITVGMSSIYRQNTAFVKTKSLLNKLIINTIENGLVTSVCAIGNIIVYFLRAQDLINIAFQYIIGGLYAIVFITTLNKRAGNRTDGGTSISLSDVQAFSNHSLGNRSGRPEPPSNRSGNFHITALRAMDNGKVPRDVIVSVSTEVHKDSMPMTKAY
ncbi:hypothetical protein FA13DRAFT_1790029 [Coprinellus micaceus]|uniref:DUF6534 domain-containing protein n=1 Tax=Coprinellus micaceus TaxID=71717 RepID=A0A4Y7TI78_COPMI|nr:hypothetical protein FA13DRAFT_1790029 [Coprinellus micaceus]